MKKLLSLTLVMMLLFTTISITSVSALSEDIVLVEADIASSPNYAGLDGKGTDAWTEGSSAKASRGASEYKHSDGNTYINTVNASLTTSTAASATHPNVASVGNDVPLIKMTQTSIASIYRMFFADGDLSVQEGDKLSISFKFYADDPYTTAATKEGDKTVAGTKSADPVSFSWNFGFLNASSGGQGAGISTKTYTTGQWYDINLTYNVTASNIATYKKIYGVISRGGPNFSADEVVTTAYPGTMYITAPVIKVARAIPSGNITVTKIGEGTVEGGGEFAYGEEVTVTATPAEGYVFEGWYDNATNVIVSRDAEYTFEATEDKDIYAYFIKAAVDGVTVTAEATNGTVYGTGAYAKGANVTLNAGADAGYKFAGYYKKDTDEPLSANPTHTFIVNEDTTVVAKFTALDDYVPAENVIYHFSNETGDVGAFNNWMYLDITNDGKIDSSDGLHNGQVTSAKYNTTVTYHDMAAYGIYRPYDSKEFGDVLYQQKATEITTFGQVAGRFRYWENGTSSGASKYVSGRKYKLTWWVYPVQHADNQATATIKISIGYDTARMNKSFTVKIGQWNKIEYYFTADDTLAAEAPGIRYDWTTSNAKWSLYDNITVEEAMDFGDSNTPSGGWMRYNDQADFTGKANNNCSTNSLADYSDYPSVPKASATAGDKVVVLNYKKPNLVASEFKPVAGSAYENMEFDEAYAYLTRPENAGSQIGGRFNDIASAGTLDIGSTYKISYMVYIPEVKNIKTGEVVSNPTIYGRILGTHTGQTAVGDGQDVYVPISTGKWYEVGYTFKATEKGADCAPSFKFDITGLGINAKVGLKDNDIMAELIFIDDAKVERVHLDDLALVIKDDDTTVTATATVNDIKSGDTLKAIVIIAAYDADGKLIDVALSSENGEYVAVDGTLTATYTKDPNEVVAKYVAFLWDDLTNIKPYVRSVTLGE